MIEQLIAEATECDFKVALETKKPKSWLKSVSAFSNGIGGTLFFGVSDDREPIGLSDVQKDAEAISRLIKERITPLPQFILSQRIKTSGFLLHIYALRIIFNLCPIRLNNSLVMLSALSATIGAVISSFPSLPISVAILPVLTLGISVTSTASDPLRVLRF